MINSFNLYKTLLSVCIKNNLYAFAARFSGGKRKRDKEKNSTISLDTRPQTAGGEKGKIVGVLSIVAAVLFTFVYVAAMAASIAGQYVREGMTKEYLYSACMLVQLVTLMTGTLSTLNNLYFDKDNALLLSLPIRSEIVFAAKFTVAYLSQLIVSLLTALPLLIVYGIMYKVISGVSFGAGYYVVSVVAAFVLPAFPLFLISVLAIPCMLFVSLFKNRDLGKNVVVTTLSLLTSGLYILIVVGANFIDEDSGQLSSGTLSTLAALSKGGYYNYNLVSSLCGISPVVNLIFYLLEVIGVFALCLLISALFYGKGLSIVTEQGGSRQKKERKRRENFVSSRFLVAFLKKELRVVYSNARLVISIVVSAVMIPVFSVVMLKSNALDFSGEGISTFGTELMFVGMVSCLSAILMVSANMYSMSGFSIEGPNFALLKSLPIRPKDLLNAKVAAAAIGTMFLSLIAGVSYIAASEYHNVLVGTGLFLSLSLNGLGSVFIGMRSDIKKPNLKYNNLNELTNNNTRIIKPMIIVMLVSFVCLALGIVLSLLCSENQTTLSDGALYGIFFAASFIINGLYVFIPAKKLYDNFEEYYYRIEV